MEPELHPVVEQDLQALAAEVAKSRERPENRLLSGQEVLKNSIRAYTAAQASAPAPAAAASQDDSVLPGYAGTASAQTKQEVEHLLGLALREGVTNAAAQAAKSNPYVLDAFHDALAGKLYPELQRRKLVD